MSDAADASSSRRLALLALGALTLGGLGLTPILYARSPAASTPAAQPVPLSAASPQDHPHRPLAADTLYSTADNEAAAEAEASRLFAAVIMPAGARVQPEHEVANALDASCQLPQPNSAVRTGWWAAPQAEAAVQDFVESHPERNVTQQGYQGIDGDVLCIDFAGAVTNAYEAPAIVVALTGAGASTDIRVDVSVTWLPGKSPLEVIPPRSSGALLTARYDVGLGRVTTIALLALNADQAQQLLTDVDSLPAVAQGQPFGCGSDTGYRAVIAVDGVGGERETFTYWPACSVVLVDTTGVQLPALQASPVLGEDIAAWVGAPPP